MARNRFAVSAADVMAIVRDDPTTAYPAGKDFMLATSGVTIWSLDRATQITDLLACNETTLASGAAITTVTPGTNTGRICFFGPDGYNGAYYAKDAQNRFWLVLPENVANLNSTLGAQISTVANEAAFKALLNLETADINTIIAAYLGANLGASIQTYLDANNYVKNFSGGPAAAFPTTGVREGDTFDRLATASTGYSFTDLGRSDPIATGAGTTVVVTPSATGGTDQVLAHVWGVASAATVTGGTNAAGATSMSGGGRTWTKITGSEQVSANGQIASAVFRGVGTGTTGAVTATFPTGLDGRGVRLIQTTGGAGGVTQSGISGSTSGATPSVTLSGVNAAHGIVGFYVHNSSTQTIAPSSGSSFTDIGNQVSAVTSSTGFREAAFTLPTGQGTMALTASSTAQKLVSLVELS